MGLFKKTAPKPAPAPVAQSVSYPIEVVYWRDHYEALSQLIKSSDLDLNDLKASGNFSCKLVPEPDNEYDKNAVKVSAALKGRGKKTWYDIGYIPSEVNQEIRADIKKVVAGTHYWSLRISFDARNGLILSIYLNESAFN